ncbi:MAG: hypothetical protein KAX49_19240 [Halanaerobiales bacterium]|nr:hypothetical protein [Halanaerobiales bacterium]
MDDEKRLLKFQSEQLLSYKDQTDKIIGELNKQNKKMKGFKKLENILEVKIKNIIKAIDDVRLKLVIDDHNILLEKKDKGIIIFSEYTFPVGRDIEDTRNLNNVYQNCLKHFTRKLKVIYQKLEGLDKENSSLKNRIKSLKNEIQSLSSLEDDLKDILTNSLNYIKTNSVDRDIDINCPVCNREFEATSLLKVIEDRLSQSNPIIDERMSILKELEKKLKEVNEKLTLGQSNFEREFEYYKEIMKEVKKDLLTLKLGFEESELEKKNNAGLIENKLENMLEENDKILSLIKAEELPVDKDKINNELTEKLDKVKKDITELGYSIDKINLDYQQELNRFKTELSIFENKLSKNRIDKENIATSVEEKLKKLILEHEKLEKSEDRLGYIETKVMEIKDMLTNNDNVRKLTKIKSDLKENNDEVRKLRNAIVELEKLEKSVVEVVQEMNESIIAEQEEFIKNMFRRINPHPYFRNINLLVDKNRHDSRTLGIFCSIEESGENKIDPAFTFSTAQTNIVISPQKA